MEEVFHKNHQNFKQKINIEITQFLSFIKNVLNHIYGQNLLPNFVGQLLNFALWTTL